MAEISHTAHEMIANMTPVRRPGAFVFATSKDCMNVADIGKDAIACFLEDEGTSYILPVSVAEYHKLPTDQPMGCITLNVYSSLEGVGLTAAVSAALGQNKIPCNMVAAFHHDHVFVPINMCERAIEILLSLQNENSEDA